MRVSEPPVMPSQVLQPGGAGTWGERGLIGWPVNATIEIATIGIFFGGGKM